jgi:formylglycine-generating enzyme required for sulfatase activity
MESLLRTDLAFTSVRRIEDAALAEMQREIREFVRQVRPGDLAFFYYSGHGIQVGGTNWMIPVDFRADFEDEVPDQAYSVQRLLSELEGAGASVRVLILDACRDNPLPAAARRSGRDGLASMNGTEGTYLLFATGENQTASDNPRGSNGLFTSHLLEAMRRPGITLDGAFKETRRQVAAASGGHQRPWMATDIDQDLVLLPLDVSAKDSAASDAWNNIVTSQNPEDFEAFAQLFPKSALAPTAKRIALDLRRITGDANSAKPERIIRTKINAADGLSYVWIPLQQFTMGCSSGDRDCQAFEKPAHRVALTRGFWIGQTEVTQEAYVRVTGSNPSAFKGPELPAEQVSWSEARAYCEAIGMRLPTEAEWEYAARGGAAGPRYGPLDSIAWNLDNSDGKTHEAGRKLPNVFGLYDMLGNVSEWVADWSGVYPSTSVSDPRGPSSGTHHLARGGSWFSVAGSVRASFRFESGIDFRAAMIGVRCAGD